MAAAGVSWASGAHPVAAAADNGGSWGTTGGAGACRARETDHGDGDGGDRGSSGTLQHATDKDGDDSGRDVGGVFGGPQSGSLVKVTSAGPNGSLVAPGQTINVTITWNPRDFGRFPPVTTADCVKIGPRISRTLSQEHTPGPWGGTDHFSYVVPLDGTGGDQICDRAIAIGPWANTDRSAVLCYSLLAAVTPEVSAPVLLPVAAAVVGGGALLVARRRRRRLAA